MLCYIDACEYWLLIGYLAKLRGSTDTSSSANPSIVNPTPGILTSVPPRDTTAVAPPPPVTRLLHPTRVRHSPTSQDMNIFRAINDMRPPAPECENMNSSPDVSVRGELRVPQDPDVDPPVDLESDDDIPSAQPQRPPDPVNVVQRNPRDTPPPETLAEALNDLNSSQDLPLQDADLVRLQEFRTKWFDVFSADSSWQDFSTQCETFAVETRSLAQELSRPQLLRTAKPPDNPPP